MTGKVKLVLERTADKFQVKLDKYTSAGWELKGTISCVPGDKERYRAWYATLVKQEEEL